MLSPRLPPVLLVLLLGLPLAPPAIAPARPPGDDLPVLGDASSGIVSPRQEACSARTSAPGPRAIADHLDPLSSTGRSADRGPRHLQRSAQHDLSIVLIEAASINAFAAPGGIIGVNLGTYAQAPWCTSSPPSWRTSSRTQRHYARGLEEQRKLTLPYLRHARECCAHGRRRRRSRRRRAHEHRRPSRARNCATAVCGSARPIASASRRSPAPVSIPGPCPPYSSACPPRHASRVAHRSSCSPTR